MRLSYIIICLFLHFGCDNPKKDTQASSDDFYEKSRKLVLSENEVGREYFFSRKVKGVDEICITYLGNIITGKKDTIKILNSVNFSGQFVDAKHGSGNVFIYNNQNKRIGYYYVGAAWSIPSKIEGETLIFNYTNEFCDQSTVISLKDSIPTQIFVNCTTKGGDLYSFKNE